MSKLITKGMKVLMRSGREGTVTKNYDYDVYGHRFVEVKRGKTVEWIRTDRAAIVG